jgi:UDP-N-acetylglucosamine--N-acetylmuramyl-(pentapeptide) pyrophosphoryl-undecaprenol N-acetylglucosamine transferase
VEALRRHAPNAHQITFVGSSDGFERPIIQQSGIAFDHFYEVSAGPLNGVGVARALGSTAKIAWGITQATRILSKHQPQAILLTGGWANVPVALAAAVLRVPMLVYLPDIEPGKTIQYLSRIAKKVAVTVGDSKQYFPNVETVVTGYPLRQNVMQATREAGQAHFKLDGMRPTVLFFGGSRGARSINQAVEAILPDLLELAQVIHVTGTLDWERNQATVAPHPDYHAYSYLHDEMGLAMAVADIAVCRSGASTLGELPYFGLPSVLVPYPHAWRYQKTNADYLVSRGAAVRLDDQNLSQELLPTLRTLLQDKVQLEVMKHNARQAASGGADALARELRLLAGESA